MNASGEPAQGRSWTPSTLAVTAGRPQDSGAPLNTPVVLASNFRDGGDYGRTHGTATWEALETAIGALEGGRTVSYASGMAAAAAVLYAFAPNVIVLPRASYLGVRSLFAEHERQGRLFLRPVDIADTAAVIGALDGADLLWIETPTNPTLDVADLPALVAAARRLGVPSVLDATFATPLHPGTGRPLEMGVSVVMHSATKFIGGHSDLLLGVCSTTDDEVFHRLWEARTFQGATPGALEAFLALRGLRTLAIRLEAATRSAGVLVERLRSHPAVVEVRYPGWGAMVSFVMADGAPAADAVCAAVRLAVPATSLGGVETTIERRQKYTGDAHVAPGLLRMSVGIEDVDDLWADLAAAIDAATN